MYSRKNKVLSIVMSAAILLTNMMAPIKVFADEAIEPTPDLETEMPLETEPASYYLTLPYNEAISYGTDDGHVVWKEDPEDRNIHLAYHEGDHVAFSFQNSDTVYVKEIHLRDSQMNEYPFSVDGYKNITFLMPAADLEFILLLEEILVPVQDVETEQTEEPVPVIETEGIPEQSDYQEEGINEFDLTAQEVVGEPSLYTYEDGSGFETEEGSSDDSHADDLLEEEIFGYESENDYAGLRDECDIIPTETGEAPGEGSEERSEGNIEIAEDEDNSKTPDIVLTAETEEDGLPAQGSILTTETLTIPLMDVDFSAETEFAYISFDSETDQVELVSNEVDITNPGTYSTIYRVNHNGGEKMWYVLRPVVVLETTENSSGDIPSDENPSGEGLMYSQEKLFTETEPEELQNDAVFGLETNDLENETEDLSEGETEELSEQETEALEEAETETPASESRIPSSITYSIWRTPGELDSPAAEDETGNNAVFSVSVENNLDGAQVILSREDGKYAAGSVVRADITGRTENGFILSVAAGDEVLFGTIDFGSEDPLPVYFYMPDGDVQIVLDGLSSSRIENSINENGEEEITIPFAGKMLKAAVNANSLNQHTASDIFYINFTSGEKAYFPNGYDAATMKTVVIYYKNGTNSGTRRAFCVDHYMGPPQDGSGITNFSESSEMSKLMYFNFGGPGFDLKIGGESVKDIMNESGLTDDHHYQMMSHLILAWQYRAI